MTETGGGFSPPHEVSRSSWALAPVGIYSPILNLFPGFFRRMGHSLLKSYGYVTRLPPNFLACILQFLRLR